MCLVFRRSQSDSSGGEEGDRRDSHDCRGEPSEDLGGVTVDVGAPEALAAGDPHDHHEEGCGGDAVDHGDGDEEFDRVDVEETECGAP